MAESEEGGLGQSAAAAVIVIKKKKGGHGGHHGGAWKVAYADFVTAMMALFIVLWLMNTSSRVQKAIGGYFKDPTGIGKMVGTSVAGSGEGVPISKDDMSKLKEKLNEAFRQIPEFEKLKKNIDVMLTPEGLRLELLENETGLFFESGKPAPSTEGVQLLEILAAELGKLPNEVLIEGHTDSRPFTGGGTYTNWELSSDRANAARRIMQEHGLRANQVLQVRGFADQHLRKKDDPAHPSNRRISVLVQSLNAPPPHEAVHAEGGGEHGGGGGEHGAAQSEHGAAVPPAEKHEEAKPSPVPQQAPPAEAHGAPNQQVHH